MNGRSRKRKRLGKVLTRTKESNEQDKKMGVDNGCNGDVMSTRAKRKMVEEMLGGRTDVTLGNTLHGVEMDVDIVPPSAKRKKLEEDRPYPPVCNLKCKGLKWGIKLETKSK